MIIKEWFLNKNFTDNERYVISVSESEVLKETEKAVYVEFKSEFGNIKTWIPKSCIMTAEEVKAQNEVFENAVNKYEKLIAWAKENGLKVRNKMKKVTILKTIEEAGLEVPAELV